MVSGTPISKCISSSASISALRLENVPSNVRAQTKSHISFRISEV